MIKGVFIIMFYLFLGETASYLISGIIPGSVMGMVLLFTSLLFGLIKADDVRKVSELLTKNMTLFFVPASIGVMAAWNLVARNWIALTVMTVVSTVLVIVAVASIQQYAEKRKQVKQKQ